MCCHAVWQHLNSVLRNLLPPSSGSYREEACSSETLQMSYRPHSIISQRAGINTGLTNKIKFKKGARIKVPAPGCVLRLEVVSLHICCAFSYKNFK